MKRGSSRMRSSRKIEGNDQLGPALLKALGIERKLILSVSIECESGQLPHVVIKQAIPQGFSKAAAQALEQYELRLKSQKPLADLDECVPLSNLTQTTFRQRSPIKSVTAIGPAVVTDEFHIPVERLLAEVSLTTAAPGHGQDVSAAVTPLRDFHLTTSDCPPTEDDKQDH